MKCLRVFFLMASACASIAPAADAKPGWLTDFKQAKERAQSSKKLILVDFTGSDWCLWCIKVDKEVFSKPEFKEYADKNLVLLEVDFPKRKKLSEIQQAHNTELAAQFGVQEYPTILLLDENGRQLRHLDYMAAGPRAFIAALPTASERARLQIRNVSSTAPVAERRTVKPRQRKAAVSRPKRDASKPRGTRRKTASNSTSAVRS